MSLRDQLYPFAGSHAIQSAVFAFEWAEMLTPSMLAGVRERAMKLKHDFPAGIQDQKALTVNFTPGAPQVQTEEVSGFMLSRVSSALGGVARTITVGLHQCLIQVSDYLSWSTAKADVDRYLEVLLPAITQHRQVTVIGLQYLDIFNWRGNPAELPTAAIFRKDTKYLASNVFSVNELWHNHHGYFESHAEPQECRQLDNINVSRVENAGVHSIQILTSHRAQFRAAIWDYSLTAESLITRTLVRMHDRNKEILRDLLSDEVLEIIKLKAA